MSRMEPGLCKRNYRSRNGYDLDKIPDGAYLIGGGRNSASMLGLLKAMMVMAGKPVRWCQANSADEMFMLEDFEHFSDDITVMTADGSYGTKGFRRMLDKCGVHVLAVLADAS